MTPDERQVLERQRGSLTALSRAETLLLLDRDYARARADLAEDTAEERGYLARSMQPGRAGYSPCGIALIAARHVLSSVPAERDFEDLEVAFDPAMTSIRWKGCSPPAVTVAHAVTAWLIGDDSRAARHANRCWPNGIMDELLARTLLLLVSKRGGEVGAVLEELAPRYQAAMATKLWLQDPYAFVHVRLLASLLVAAERGVVDLAALPDVIPYAPLGFLSYLMAQASTP
jgi:hypothetical protein